MRVQLAFTTPGERPWSRLENAWSEPLPADSLVAPPWPMEMSNSMSGHVIFVLQERKHAQYSGFASLMWTTATATKPKITPNPINPHKRRTMYPRL
ncbi:hypothetical protein BST61_g2333 [Cercospora zeina]